MQRVGDAFLDLFGDAYLRTWGVGKFYNVFAYRISCRWHLRLKPHFPITSPIGPFGQKLFLCLPGVGPGWMGLNRIVSIRHCLAVRSVGPAASFWLGLAWLGSARLA